MITRRSGNALVLGGSDPRVPDEEPQNSRVISYLSEAEISRLDQAAALIEVLSKDS
jgi:hypothetical protein